MISLIDCDVIVYRSGFSSEKLVWEIESDEFEPYRFETGMSKLNCIQWIKENWKLDDECIKSLVWTDWYELEPLGYCLQRAKIAMNKILLACGTKSYKGFLSTEHDTTLFRNAIATTLPYKGNRKDFKKPYYYSEIREYLLKYYNVEQVKGIEADDALGIYQNSNTIICSIDKDLLQIPGRHYNFVKETFIDIDKLTGFKNFCSQVLTGDRADNIPGLFRVGAKTSEKLLSEAETPKQCYNSVKSMYQDKSPVEDWETYLKEQSQLCWILREYNGYFNEDKIQ